MDTDEVLIDFRSTISAQSLFYLLNDGYVNNREFIKILHCTLVFHGIGLVDLQRIIGVSSTSLKRVLGQLRGGISDETKVHICAKIIRAIENVEQAACLKIH